MPYSPDAAQAEYLARVHRVMDYIEGHLDQELALEELAKVACFSPYHFHRVFTGVVGESLYQFILRLRLEKAASQLLQQPGKSITAIALDCGFGSSATFARAFRAAFSESASAWRKNGKTNRKPRKETASRDRYVALVAGEQEGAPDLSWRQRMSQDPRNDRPSKKADEVRVETIEPMTVAYVRHVGPYAGNAALFGELFGKLCGWAGPRGLLGPQAKMLTIYHDNPEVTEESKLRISVCVTVPPGTQGSGEVGVMELPGGKYVAARFELSSDEFGAAWSWLMGTWFPSSGYQPDDRPCFEVCLNDPQSHPEKKHIVELWESVRPL